MTENLKRHSQNLSPSFAEEYIRNVWNNRLRLRGNFWNRITRYERDRSMNQRRLTVPFEDGEEVFVNVMMELYRQEILLLGNNYFSPSGEPSGVANHQGGYNSTFIDDEETYRELHPQSEVWATVLTFMFPHYIDFSPQSATQQIGLSDWTMDSALFCYDMTNGHTKLLIKIDLFWAIELDFSTYSAKYGYRMRDITLIFLPVMERGKRATMVEAKNQCLENINALQDCSLFPEMDGVNWGLQWNSWGGFKYLRNSSVSNFSLVRLRNNELDRYDEVSSYSIIDIIRFGGGAKTRTLNYSKSGFIKE
jgi:hypothetical protein